jgi:transcriptional/translational regulatory protein YebC/TACO1
VPVAEEDAAGVVKLIAALEDDDDVQTVWTNADISDETMARLGG